MRAVVQRVTRAAVRVVPEGQSEREAVCVGAIERGLLVYLGIGPHDGEAEVQWLVRKLLHLRVFADDAGKMNHDVRQIKGAILVVSQFTLYGDCQKGNRPSFAAAANPEVAEPLYLALCDALAEHLPVQRGQFGADMRVDSTIDGPVTLWLERAAHSSREAAQRGARAEPAHKSPIQAAKRRRGARRR